ncbi:hypothetical protein KUCAC02_019995, partial [Chaenocephalus aceratus]
MQLLESLLGIRRETGESSGGRGAEKDPNKRTSETVGIEGEDGESQTRRAFSRARGRNKTE